MEFFGFVSAFPFLIGDVSMAISAAFDAGAAFSDIRVKNSRPSVTALARDLTRPTGLCEDMLMTPSPRPKTGR